MAPESWIQQSQAYVLYGELKPFDLIEIKRGAYCHWVMYLEIDQIGEKTGVVIIHRNADEDTFFAAGIRASMNKQKYGLGAVCKSLLLDVVGDCTFRINNASDNELEPGSDDEIEERIQKALKDPDLTGKYNLVTNNCEHFVKWLRYGVKFSDQVIGVGQKAIVPIATQIVRLGMLQCAKRALASSIAPRLMGAAAASGTGFGLATRVGLAATSGPVIGMVAGLAVTAASSIAVHQYKRRKRKQQTKARQDYMDKNEDLQADVPDHMEEAHRPTVKRGKSEETLEN